MGKKMRGGKRTEKDRDRGNMSANGDREKDTLKNGSECNGKKKMKEKNVRRRRREKRAERGEIEREKKNG
jgi:hypothetical protein